MEQPSGASGEISKTFGPLKKGLLPPRCSRGLNCASDEATTARSVASVTPFIVKSNFCDSAHNCVRQYKIDLLLILLASLFMVGIDRLLGCVLLDSDSRYYLACSVERSVRDPRCATIGRRRPYRRNSYRHLLVFILAVHFNVEASFRDTRQADTWDTCGTVC